MTLPARERDVLERKLLDLFLQIKSIAAAVVSAQRAGPRSGTGHILTTRSGGCGASPPSELFSAPPPIRRRQEEDFAERSAPCWMLRTHTGGAAAARRKHFGGFSPRPRLLFSQCSEDMKNPVYWAVLVGMSVLLMEQGEWPRLRRSLDLLTCVVVVVRSLCAYIWHCAGDLSRSL